MVVISKYRILVVTQGHFGKTGGVSQYFEPFEREGHEKNRQQKRKGQKKLSHCDRKGIL